MAQPLVNGPIAYSSDCEICLMKPNGSGKTQLTHGGDGCAGTPAFSPDGTKIAFEVKGTAARTSS